MRSCKFFPQKGEQQDTQGDFFFFESLGSKILTYMYKCSLVFDIKTGHDTFALTDDMSD